jgi:hypothetical protein
MFHKFLEQQPLLPQIHQHRQQPVNEEIERILITTTTRTTATTREKKQQELLLL